jgi:hypothetical protein
MIKGIDPGETGHSNRRYGPAWISMDQWALDGFGMG